MGKQAPSGAPLEVKPDLFADHSQGLFSAVGELTQRLAMSGRWVIHGLVGIPSMLVELLKRLRDPGRLWSVTATSLATVIVVILGLGLQLFTLHLEGQLRAGIMVCEPCLCRRNVWIALLSTRLAAAPCVALLGFRRSC